MSRRCTNILIKVTKFHNCLHVELPKIRFLLTDTAHSKKKEQSRSATLVHYKCDRFKETSRNLEVFFIKVSKNKRRTYLKNSAV